jgi:2-amino-4-hydroxy-6-hydroxymethyldihydropteridine diphosphokinase
MTVCALSLGSNLGNRLENMRRAVDAMRPFGRVAAKSNVYETPPWGMEGQGRFLNSCLLLETDLPPQRVLSEIKEIERSLGRVPRERWGPREIDIDILTFGDGILNGPDLVVPHPSMAERAFVLVPLADIAPDFRIPPNGAEISLLLEKLDRSGIVRITSL